MVDEIYVGNPVGLVIAAVAHGYFGPVVKVNETAIAVVRGEIKTIKEVGS